MRATGLCELNSSKVLKRRKRRGTRIANRNQETVEPLPNSTGGHELGDLQGATAHCQSKENSGTRRDGERTKPTAQTGTRTGGKTGPTADDGRATRRGTKPNTARFSRSGPNPRG